MVFYWLKRDLTRAKDAEVFEGRDAGMMEQRDGSVV